MLSIVKTGDQPAGNSIDVHVNIIHITPNNNGRWVLIVCGSIIID